MMATELAVVVQASDLTASYRGLFRRHRVLRGMDLVAGPGEVTALVGPNGVGKTTFFGILLGVLRPEKGSCTVGGLRPDEYRRRQGVGYLSQSCTFPRGWTGRDLLARAADLSVRTGRSAVFGTATERAGVDSDTLSRRLSKCSNGVRRRLGLAWALAGDPSLVVLDEPFVGLDPAARVRLRDEMLAARSRGATVLFSSHELEVVARVADRVFILADGRTRPFVMGSASEADEVTRLEQELLGADP